MRKPPDIPPPEEITHQQLDLVKQTREYQLTTPLYGGGVAPGEADPVTTIRATEIRGHLRFWWRATRGGQFGDDLAALRKREGEIWGKAYQKEEKGDEQTQKDKDEYKHVVQIEITQPKKVQPFLPFRVERAMRDGQLVTNRDGSHKYQSRYNHSSDVPLYAVFPLQPTQEDLDGFSKERQLEQLSVRDLEQALFPKLKKVYQCSSFQISIAFPTQYRLDIEAALWAWETFGGIGARTRRGFGALHCISIQENQHFLPVDLPLAEQQQTRKWIEENLLLHVIDNSWAKTLPHLQKRDMAFEVVTNWNTNDPWTIWNKLIDALKDFRQCRFSSKKQNARHPGRSKWPEPSEIRKWTNQALKGHDKPIPDPHINKFPRAAFGLPIIFQFKDRNKYQPSDRRSDPRKTVLQLVDAERLSSPLILKPLACQNGAFVGLALILGGTTVEDFQLLLKTQEDPEDEISVESTLVPGESFIIANEGSSSPIRIDSQTNALQAFLKYLRSITK